MKIAIYIKEELEDTDLATYMISKISEHGFDFDQENPDYVISVGGDGTFLKAVHEYIEEVDNILFVGINEGSLGFYSDYVIDELDQLLEDLSNDEVDIKTHSLLVTNIGEKKLYAVNEIRVNAPLRSLNLDIFIDDELLENFVGSGLSVSSTLGSTGINRSLGGSVIVSDDDLLSLVPIAPIYSRVYHSITTPVIFSKEHKITLQGDLNGVYIGYDCFEEMTNLSRLDI